MSEPEARGTEEHDRITGVTHPQLPYFAKSSAAIAKFKLWPTFR